MSTDLVWIVRKQKNKTKKVLAVFFPDPLFKVDLNLFLLPLMLLLPTEMNSLNMHSHGPSNTTAMSSLDK